MQLFIKVILPIFIVLLIALGWVIYATGHEVVSTVKTLNPQTGKSRALIVWHPGQSDFPTRKSRHPEHPAWIHWRHPGHATEPRALL